MPEKTADVIGCESTHSFNYHVLQPLATPADETTCYVMRQRAAIASFHLLHHFVAMRPQSASVAVTRPSPNFDNRN